MWPGEGKIYAGGGGSLEPRTAIEGSFLAWGGLGKLDRGLALGELFFLTAIAIAIATRPFKFHENSVTNTSSSFVSSIHSLGFVVGGAEETMPTKESINMDGTFSL